MSYRPVKRSSGQGCARPQRMFQILSLLHERREADASQPERDLNAGWMTTGEIARAIGLSQSPHFRGIIDELFGQGHVEVHTDEWRKNMPVYYWRISDTARWSKTWRAAFDAWLVPEEVLS
jgi:predicted transcriptional regulator